MDWQATTGILSALIAGFIIGCWFMNRYGSVRGIAASRTLNPWARMDFVAPRPQPVNTSVVKVTDWQDAPELNLEDHTITFTGIPDRSGIRRDLTYSAAMVMRFFKCDVPVRSEWAGNNNEYTRFLAIGQHYGWVLKNGKGYTWAIWLATREKRLRVLTAWLQAGK